MNDRQRARREPAARGDELMRRVANLARELNEAPSAAAAYQAATRGLSHLLSADSINVTASVGEDRQQLCASLVGDKFERIEEGEVVRIAHTMLERCVQTGAPVGFNDVSSELGGGALLISLVCPAAQSALCAPLTFDAKTTGIIITSTTRAGAYNEADLLAAQLTAELLSSTLARLELSTRVTGAREREEARQREEVLVGRLDSVTRSSGDLEHIIQHTIDVLAHALPASFVVLRTVAFGRPDPMLRAWTPGKDLPPLEIHAPVSKSERAVYAEHRPVFIEDARDERAGRHDLRPLTERLGARSIYLAPIIYGGQILAAIGLVESDSQRRWTHDEQLLLARVAETIAPLILNAQLHASLRSYVVDLLTLLRLACDVTNEAEMDQTLRAVLDSWSKIAGTEASAILRFDDETTLLQLATSRHLPTGLLERYTKGVPLTDPVCGLAASRRVGVVADLASESRFADLHAAVRWSNLRGAWATPVTGPAGRLLGVLVTFSRVAAEVSPDEQRLADLFTRPVAIAFENMELHRNARLQAQQVKYLEEKARQSERHKTEFMSLISHELRTPLNAIIGYAQMLKDGFSGELNPAQTSDVQTIIDSADRLLSMVEETLDLARIDAERFPVYMDSVAFDEVIRRAIAGVRSTAEMKGLEIKLSIFEDAPVVRTDPERVRQILMNLLSNAVKFTDSGSIQISVERVEGGGVRVSVKDTGIGFDTEAFPQIFEEFRQADASTTRLHGGTGLGLAVSKRLVGRLGGQIGVNSLPGEGSTFWFRLPPEIPGADEQG